MVDELYPLINLIVPDRYVMKDKHALIYNAIIKQYRKICEIYGAECVPDDIRMSYIEIKAGSQQSEDYVKDFLGSIGNGNRFVAVKKENGRNKYHINFDEVRKFNAEQKAIKIRTNSEMKYDRMKHEKVEQKERLETIDEMEKRLADENRIKRKKKNEHVGSCNLIFDN